MSDEQFLGMPTASVDGIGRDRQTELDVYWPGWRRFADAHGWRLPPLDDYAVEAVAIAAIVPDWIIDGVQTVCRFGGEAWGHDDYQPHLIAGPSQWVIKPRWNPAGLSHQARLYRPGREGSSTPPPNLREKDMLQSFYEGAHKSMDIAMRDGKVLWGVIAIGYPVAGRFGRFSHWTVEASRGNRTFNDAGVWPDDFSTLHLEEALPNYSGVVNLEYIGGSLIEGHFRPALEFFPMYGASTAYALMEAACRQAAVQPPAVRGGLMQVIARGSRRVNVRREFGEESWRRNLVYTLD